MENQYVKFEITDNCILGTYKVNQIDLEVAKTVVKLRMEYQGDRKLVGIVMADTSITFDKEARDYLTGENGIRGLIAGAMIVDSPFKKNLFNFIIKFSKHPIPSKTFANLDDAKKWASTFK